MPDSCTCAENPSLAMAAMPRQEWCEPYDLCTALREGTIFPCLNLPFFKATQEINTPSPCSNSLNPLQQDREKSMSRLNAVSFALNDLTLYLDTHPTCEKGIQLFHTLMKERLNILAEHAHAFAPLTQASIVTGHLDENHYGWDEGPMPWEGACI